MCKLQIDNQSINQLISDLLFCGKMLDHNSKNRENTTKIIRLNKQLHP